MKKTALFRIATLALSVLLVVGLFAGCGQQTNDQADTTDKTIKVGASITPHAEILEQTRSILEEQGYTLEIVEFDDYIQPNLTTESGELLANYFQHQLYLDDFNAANDTHLVSVAAIHYEPFGIYAGKTKSLEELADGATIAVPNDGTNEARALFLLEAQGLITMKEGVDTTATVLDIAENPHNYDIVEISAPQLPRSLEDVDLAVINGNYALQAGLNAVDDALAIEDSQSEDILTYYKNVLVVKEGNEDDPRVKALADALQSDTVKQYIEDTYNGSVLPLF